MHTHDPDVEVMTELNEDGGPGPLGRRSVCPRRPKGYVRASRSVRAQIRPLLEVHQTAEQIVEITKLPISTVRRAISKIDAQKVRGIRKMPDAERGRVHRLMDQVIEKSLKDQPVFDRNGQIVRDKDGSIVRLEPNSASLRTVIQAADRQVKLVVGDAPTQSLNLQLKASAMVDGNLQRQALRSPRVLKAMLELEEAMAEDPKPTTPSGATIQIDPGVSVDLTRGGNP